LKATSIFAILCAIILYACQQEPDMVNNPTQPKIKTMDFTWMGTSAGYKDRIDFIYDNSGRVSSMLAYNTMNIFGAPLDSIFNFYFEYQGNNSLPYKVSTFRYVTPIKEIHYFQYNAAGQPVKDSVVTWFGNTWIFLRYTSITYTGTAVACKDSLSPFANPDLTNLTYSNGNFTAWGTGDPNAYYYDFDTGNNPLNYLNIAPVFFVLGDSHNPEHEYWSIWTLSNKNNMTRIKIGFNPSTGIASDTSFLSNHYDGNGLLQKRYYWDVYPGPIVDTVDVINFTYY
jgi:hypothetical protein